MKAYFTTVLKYHAGVELIWFESFVLLLFVSFFAFATSEAIDSTKQSCHYLYNFFNGIIVLGAAFLLVFVLLDSTPRLEALKLKQLRIRW